MMAPLPVWCQEPLARLDIVREQMKDLKEGGQAVGAQVLTDMSGFAPPTVMSQAARLMSRQRFFNLVVTNVPGPQFSLYLMGRRMIEPFPMVPLAKNQGTRHRDHELQRAHELRPERRLRRHVGHRGPRRGPRAARSQELAEAAGVELTPSSDARDGAQRARLRRSLLLLVGAADHAREGDPQRPRARARRRRQAARGSPPRRRRTPPWPSAAIRPRSPSRSCSSRTATRCS